MLAGNRARLPFLSSVRLRRSNANAFEPVAKALLLSIFMSAAAVMTPGLVAALASGAKGAALDADNAGQLFTE